MGQIEPQADDQDDEGSERAGARYKVAQAAVSKNETKRSETRGRMRSEVFGQASEHPGQPRAAGTEHQGDGR